MEKIISTRRPSILAVNKWDLAEKDQAAVERFGKELKATLGRFSRMPVVYVSALTGQRVPKVLSLVKKVHSENHKRIATSELNDFLQAAVGKKHPPARKGKYIRFYYATQSEVTPPTFVFFSNYPELIDKSYISYLNNQLRSAFGFDGVPIRLKFRKK
jgi:GTP-binding protein